MLLLPPLLLKKPLLKRVPFASILVVLSNQSLVSFYPAAAAAVTGSLLDVSISKEDSRILLSYS